MLAVLRAARVETWFDLGLILDRLREDRAVPGIVAPPDFDAFVHDLQRGIGFVTFDFGVDGVSMEIAKYAEALRTLMPEVRVHYIAGRFADPADHIIDHDAEWHCVPEIDGFDAWPLYRDFFTRKLERGGPLYNDLIGRFWEATLVLCEALGRIVESRDLQLLYLVNINSNPGNPALALAMALISEFLRVPVVNNCHDFYWEGGHSQVEREVRGLARGPRDHFFTNADVGEVFSIIELLYPWESRHWVHLCINGSQISTLRQRFGLNPGNLCAVGTAIDTARFAPLGRRHIKEAWSQVSELLRDGRTRVTAHAAESILKDGRLDPKHRRPILISATTQRQVDFASNNTVLLQPTRIVSRKRIEVTFKLVRRLFADAAFDGAFRQDTTKKLTLLVTGPVAGGHDGYLDRLVRDFGRLLEQLDAAYRNRVYLGFLFSAFDDAAFRARHERALGMPELYNLASLVVLPSETEGRGLPIIESAACCVPIMTRRYEPVEVFREVVGELLAREDRLEVNVFEGSSFADVTIARLVERLLEPDKVEALTQHNRNVVERRFNMGALVRDLEATLQRLHLQLSDSTAFRSREERALKAFHERVSGSGAARKSLLQTENREYLPGYGRMGFMLMLKSLIDPSYFRVEEQRLRGMAFDYAQRLETAREAQGPVELADRLTFYNSVEALFLTWDGEMPVRLDHSFAYRHRNRRRYPYRELTPQELTGVITLIHRDLFGALASPGVSHQAIHQVASWHLMVTRCCGGEPILDDRDRLLGRIGENVPFALFTGPLLEHELELFVLQAARLRLGLGAHEEITRAHLDAGPALAPITLVKRRESIPGEIDANTLSKYLAEYADSELTLLFQRGICRVIASEQVSLGIDFRQLGSATLTALLKIRDASGFMIALCEQAAMTTDIAAIERYHIGRADDPLTAGILGIPEGSGYVSWLPAGLRSTLAYPTPVQTAKSLSETLSSRRYRRLCKRLGEEVVLEALSDDAARRGSRVEDVLAEFSATSRTRTGPVRHEALNGLYADGCPWSGVIARVEGRRPLRYTILSSGQGNKTVPEFVRRFNRTRGRRARIAWNGGYILNAELVGKLGLPESYIGSPLGLILSKGRVLSPPLFNKPAFMVGKDHSLAIRRVSCEGGLRARAGRNTIEFPPQSYNPEQPGDAPCFYDLMHPDETLPGDGRILVRLVGARIIEVRATRVGEAVPILPVGLVFSFPRKSFPSEWEEGRMLALELPGLTQVAEAVEAGPLLLDQGEIAIDMECEGWKTRNSILTQAARLDYLDMRGPKIAIGLDGDGTLMVLAVNGRIRESTGATHIDMAQILKSRGVRTAMGFDPGGSATLVVGGEPLNISPYNPDYERNIYSLPPEPRGVANAIIGY